MRLEVTHAAPTEIAVHRPDAQRMGFFTDTTTCIGCKACEVACKQWNDLPAEPSRIKPGTSYDNTNELAASTWRHVRFLELLEPSERGHLPSIPATHGRRPTPAAGGRRPRARPPTAARPATGSSCPTCASTARTPAASTPARPAR